MAQGMGIGNPYTLPAQPTPAAPFQPQQGQSGIAGALPFDAMGANATLPTDLNSLGAHYGSAYRSALAMNSSNYTNILAGYQQTLAQQTKAQDAIAGGYTGLYNDVLGQLGTQGQSQREQINRDYAANLGRGSQQLIDRGLGNSTVQSAVERGLEKDRAFAGNALNEQVARQNADYMSRLGVQGLQYRDAANMQNTQLAGRQLDWMNSVNAPYPDAGMYSMLAQQYGMAQEARDNRDQFSKGGGRMTNPAGVGGGVGGVYGRHFSDSLSDGGAGGYVQLGGGGGGGGYGNLAGGIGSYISPGQDFGGGYAAAADPYAQSALSIEDFMAQDGGDYGFDNFGNHGPGVADPYAYGGYAAEYKGLGGSSVSPGYDMGY